MEPDGGLHNNHPGPPPKRRPQIAPKLPLVRRVELAHQHALKHPAKLDPEDKIWDVDNKANRAGQIPTLKSLIRPNDARIHWWQNRSAVNVARKVIHLCNNVIEWPPSRTNSTTCKPSKRPLRKTGGSTTLRINSYWMTSSERFFVEGKISGNLYIN